ncbi:hypothetical protein PsorP6_005994 [Peronosclerospora sorghi]|uniref:Uncharacterized protein n=1 Tax=Peronosclerospora sorghi TaxID=230839 RepID=A0ACC0W6K1_9STRA|nr:hypothetical protein PsorP6_005994 [Peronosclerospora sorghi]
MIEEKALDFDAAFKNEPRTVFSLLYDKVIETSVDHIFQTESSQDTMSSTIPKSSVVDVTTDEFKYQRLEREEVFGPLGRAQSCHLMSREHCRKYSIYQKYDNDKSKRLALSPEIHGWYDALTVTYQWSTFASNQFRSIKMILSALDDDYCKLISMRLKGFVVLEDHLEMQISVYVVDPKVFCEWIEWKRKRIEKC